jgi:hypothetical protein
MTIAAVNYHPRMAIRFHGSIQPNHVFRTLEDTPTRNTVGTWLRDTPTRNTAGAWTFLGIETHTSCMHRTHDLIHEIHMPVYVYVCIHAHKCVDMHGALSRAGDAPMATLFFVYPEMCCLEAKGLKPAHTLASMTALPRETMAHNVNV